MSISRFISRLSGAGTAALVATVALPASAATALADKPVLASVSVPGNLALALSVEYPTAVSNAHTDATYASSSTYLGYFDPDKCYDYKRGDSSNSGTAIPYDHFVPAAKASAHTCSGKWSGNFMNWATMQTVDPFRWALTGGYRVFDTNFATVVEKAYASGQGGTNNFPDRTITDTTVIRGATPLKENGAVWNGLKLRVQGMGVQLRFTNSGDNNNNTLSGFDPAATSWKGSTSYVVDVRARVCDKTLGLDFLEPNKCKAYGDNYKPEGLIQQYANQIRFSAFGYLNDGNLSRDGGVMRSRQKFVGPTQPVPGSDPVTNPQAEWEATTGIMRKNPNVDSAKSINDVADMLAQYAIAVDNSGVMNYLNKFGASQSYKTFDPVSELYYTVLRYYRNLGNVASYSSSINATQADGFPVITKWDDPIQYSCQKNFILGIGDVNTHADRNLPGVSNPGSKEPPSKPAEVTADKALDTVLWTNRVGTLSGVNSSLGSSLIGSNNAGYLIAGMAYWANSTDIRPDVDEKTTGMQTIQTYWLDVLEFSSYAKNNQYYLATRFGGANLPTGYNPETQTSDLTQSWWHTGDKNDTVGGQLRPDTYFTSAKADQMVNGLASAFASIASRMKAFSTGFSTPSQEVTKDGVSSYATLFDAKDWTGEVIASTLKSVDGSSSLGRTEAWRFSIKLAAQLATKGWDTNRAMVTWNTSSNAGVPFRYSNLASDQKAALDTPFIKGDDGETFLNYLRGDTTQEVASVYRTRSSLVGDIVNSKVRVVPPPSLTLAEGATPGYGVYRNKYSSRPNYLVVGTNAGVVHVIDGSVTGATAGREIFAYVPGGAFNGPSSPATPAVDGLQSLGNPSFSHRFFVDARPTSMDVDFSKTVGGGAENDWRTIVVGGLGKGGKRIYALDLTDLSDIKPGDSNAEKVAARKVLWEFTAPDMGFFYGEPLITRTAQFGWVVLVPSGYNNKSGKVHIYVLNPRDGSLLATIDGDTSDNGTEADPSGLGQVTSFYLDLSTLLIESVYGGDLRGNVWRADLRPASGGFPAMTKVARAVGPNNTTQSITTAVMPVVDPVSFRRFLAFGTGKLLDANDINNSDLQRLYAVADGSLGKFNSSSDLPSGVTFPVTSSNLVQLTDLTAGADVDYRTKMGWYYDVTGGYRVLNDPAYYQSTVAFAATLPTLMNPCNPSGSSRVYMIDLGSGKTTFANNALYVEPGFAVTDMLFVKDGDNVSLMLGGANPASNPSVACKPGDPTCMPCRKGDPSCCPPDDEVCKLKQGKPPNYGTKILNWREVPLRTPSNGTY